MLKLHLLCKRLVVEVLQSYLLLAEASEAQNPLYLLLQMVAVGCCSDLRTLLVKQADFELRKFKLEG